MAYDGSNLKWGEWNCGQHGLSSIATANSKNDIGVQGCMGICITVDSVNEFIVYPTVLTDTNAPSNRAQSRYNTTPSAMTSLSTKLAVQQEPMVCAN